MIGTVGVAVETVRKVRMAGTLQASGGLGVRLGLAMGHFRLGVQLV